MHGGAVVVAGDESRQGEFSFWTGGDAADLYQVWFRDRLPFEDETGAVPLPPR